MSDHDDGLGWLSEDERAALDDDMDDDGAGAHDDLDEDAAEGDDDAAQAPRAGAKAGEEKPAAGSPGKGQPAGEADEEGPPAAFTPVYRAGLPADYQQRVDALAAASQTLAKQYEDGDFDLAEFQAKQRQLSEQEWALRATALKAEMAREQQQQTMAQRWVWEQEAYFRKPEHRAFRDDPVIAHAFEGALKLLAADQANESKDMPWFLAEAGQMTRDKLRDLAQGLGLVGTSPATAAAGPRGVPRGNGWRGNKASPPPTLGRLPSAATPDPGGDEFSHLDKLGGMDAERALARLTPEQLDRYLAA